jgi:hypothetical protein
VAGLLKLSVCRLSVAGLIKLSVCRFSVAGLLKHAIYKLSVSGLSKLSVCRLSAAGLVYSCGRGGGGGIDLRQDAGCSVLSLAVNSRPLTSMESGDEHRPGPLKP